MVRLYVTAKPRPTKILTGSKRLSLTFIGRQITAALISILLLRSQECERGGGIEANPARRRGWVRHLAGGRGSA